MNIILELSKSILFYISIEFAYIFGIIYIYKNSVYIKYSIYIKILLKYIYKIHILKNRKLLMFYFHMVN